MGEIHQKDQRDSVYSAVQQVAGNKKGFELSDGQIAAFKTAAEVALAIIAAAGMIAVSAVAPNLFSAVGKFYKLNKHSSLSRREQELKTRRLFYYLKESGLIKFKTDKTGLWLSLTRKGKIKISQAEFDSLMVFKPKRWEGYWWEIASDIPTKEHRNGADALRSKLEQMGFCHLQKSLWFYPHDPRKEIQKIVDYYDISQFVTVMRVAELDKSDEKVLKRHFRKKGVM